MEFGSGMGSVANGGQELLQILEGTQETGRQSATCRHNSSECIAIWVTVILPQANTAAMREHLKVITDAVAPARIRSRRQVGFEPLPAVRINRAGSSFGYFGEARIDGLAQQSERHRAIMVIDLHVIVGRDRAALPLAAEKGNAVGEANLGVLYAAGRGGLAKNEYDAARLFRLAADQGNAVGEASLAFFYQNGRGGLPKNVQEAVRLYRLAADQGLAFAQTALRGLRVR